MLDSTNALERRRLVALLAGRGVPTTKIAAHLGVPVNVVRTDRMHLSTTIIDVPDELEKKRKYIPMSREERLATNKLKLQPEVVAARRAAVPKLYAKGMTDTEIGKALGVTATTVARDRKKLGIAPLDFTKPTVMRQEKVKDMLAKGITQAEIARTLGVAIPTVHNDVRSLYGKPVPQSVKAARNREVVRKLLTENKTAAQIARELNVSETSVWRYKRQIAEEDAAS